MADQIEGLAPDPNLWFLNRTEWKKWTEFVWTGNGPGPELDTIHPRRDHLIFRIPITITDEEDY